MTSSSATLAVRSTASVSTAPASVSRDGTAGTALWRAAARLARAVELTGSAGRARGGSGPVTVRTAGGGRAVYGAGRAPLYRAAHTCIVLAKTVVGLEAYGGGSLFFK